MLCIHIYTLAVQLCVYDAVVIRSVHDDVAPIRYLRKRMLLQHGFTCVLQRCMMLLLAVASVASYILHMHVAVETPKFVEFDTIYVLRQARSAAP